MQTINSNRMTTTSIKRQLLFQTISLLTFLLFFSGTNKNYASLEISIKDCRSNKLEYLDELFIIKDNKRIKSLKPEHNYIQTLTKLDLGTYFLEYKSLFGKTEKKKVTISQFKKYSVDLCMDYINYSKETYKPIIDQLQEKENYKILMSSQGCFHSSADTLIIFRVNNTYSATWKTKKKNLTKSDIEAIRHFEIELNYMNVDACTTTDTYTIIYKNKTKKIEDGSCDWNGDNYLEKKLFGTP